MPENLLFGTLQLDDRISDCPYRLPADIRPLLRALGQSATWRTLLTADSLKLCDIPGYGQKTADALLAFVSTHVKYSFVDLL